MVKRTKFITLALMMTFVSQLLASKKVVQPYFHNKIVKVKSGDKNPTSYFTLSRKFSTNIKVGGPGKVSLFLRSVVEEGAEKGGAFTVKYIIDGKKVKVNKIKPISVSSKSSIIGKDEKVTVVKKVNFTVPPGSHIIEFFVLNNGAKVFSKYYFEKYPAPKWKAQPLSKKSEEVVLVSTKKNKENKYQRISTTESIKVKAKEKSYLRIIVRAEFKAYMFSDNTLRIHVKENGKIIKTIQVSSTRAKYSIYKKGGKLVPGTLNKFYITVPKGDHEYEIVVADGSKTALVKVSYDEKRYPKKTKK